MKIMKRISVMILTVCLLIPCFSMLVFAADGIIFFTDLETSVGETFTITGTVVVRGGEAGDAVVRMSYDTTYIRFVEGDGVNADSNGTLTYTGSGDGNSDRIEFTMTFQALQEGSTRMEQDSANVTDAYGDTVECESGYADIAIGEGDPSLIVPMGKTTPITVDGVEYTLSEAFNESELPTGFVSGDITYNGEMYKGAVQEASGISALYLIDGQQAGEFWLYNSETSTFYPLEEIVVSDMYSIIILDGSGEVKLPEKYTEASIDINGSEFPGWIEPDRDGFYMLYAVNNEGQKSLYLYDSQEHTYQRMETPKDIAAPEKTVGLWDRISEAIIDYLVWIVTGAGCLLVVLLVVLIVTAIKLRHRNLELDELYDEYGIDAVEDETEAEVRRKTKGKRDAYRDDDNFEDDYYDEEEYYDTDDELAELREEFMSVGPKARNYDEYYDEDDFEEDEYVRESSRKKVRREDTFEMDFIDLD